MLVAAGCNVNITTPNGSALHEAALCGKEKVVKILLNEGINLDLTDCDGRTVFDVLDDFPAHVVQRIRNIINHYYQRSSLYDSESDDHHNIVVDSRRSRRDPVAIEYQLNTTRNYHEKQLNLQNRNNLYSDQNDIYGETSSPSSMGSFGASSSGFLVQTKLQKSPAAAPSKPPRKSLSISPPHHSKHKNIMTKSFEFDLDQEYFEQDPKPSKKSQEKIEKPSKNGDKPKKSPYEYLYLSQTQEKNQQNKRNSLRTSDDEPKSDFEYTIMSGPLTIPRNFKNDDNKIVRVMNPHRKLKKSSDAGLKYDSE